MGRYDGEDYAATPPCAPGRHNFQPNGLCHVCRNSEADLVRVAQYTIDMANSGRLGCPHDAVGPNGMCTNCGVSRGHGGPGGEVSDVDV